jgi:hypothetical protein
MRVKLTELDHAGTLSRPRRLELESEPAIGHWVERGDCVFRVVAILHAAAPALPIVVVRRVGPFAEVLRTLAFDLES